MCKRKIIPNRYYNTTKNSKKLTFRDAQNNYSKKKNKE